MNHLERERTPTTCSPYVYSKHSAPELLATNSITALARRYIGLPNALWSWPANDPIVVKVVNSSRFGARFACGATTPSSSTKSTKTGVKTMNKKTKERLKKKYPPTEQSIRLTTRWAYCLGEIDKQEYIRRVNEINVRFE